MRVLPSCSGSIIAKWPNSRENRVDYRETLSRLASNGGFSPYGVTFALRNSIQRAKDTGVIGDTSVTARAAYSVFRAMMRKSYLTAFFLWRQLGVSPDWQTSPFIQR